MTALLSAVTTDGDGTAVGFSKTFGTAIAEGTFDGATVTLEARRAGVGEWIAVGSYTTFTAAGFGNFQLANGVELRGSVSSAGATTSVTLTVL
jgi:hypothetical protein